MPTHIHEYSPRIQIQNLTMYEILRFVHGNQYELSLH